MTELYWNLTQAKYQYYYFSDVQYSGKMRLAAEYHCGSTDYPLYSTAEKRDYPLYYTAENHEKSRISRRKTNQRQKYFFLLVRGLDGIDLWKKPEVENLVTMSL